VNALELQAALDLPEPLPRDETVLWLGQPEWRSVALEVCHARLIGVYFAALLAWRAATAFADGGGAAAALSAVVGALPFIGIVAGIVVGFAVLVARTSVYAITTRRTLLRIGIALSVTINLPHRMVDSAAVRLFADGSGDIPLTLKAPNRVAYAVLWPHARPWHVRQPEPMLRGVPAAAEVARLLAKAVAALDPTVSTRDPVTERAHSAQPLEPATAGVPHEGG
jgi:hypothetical protein